MNRDTARAIIAAAALMTVQALLLAALATSTAHASKVYRCAAPTPGASVSYQPHPCQQGAGTATHVADTRTSEQQAQASDNHARQMAWLGQQASKASATKARTPSTKKRRAKRRSQPHGQQAAAAPQQAGALTSHRIGQRPFEHRGQQVTPSDTQVRKPRKRKHTPYEITARVPPASGTAGQDPHAGVRPSR